MTGFSTFTINQEVLNTNSLIIREPDDQGSVPELIAINRGIVLILLLDGEELVGVNKTAY